MTDPRHRPSEPFSPRPSDRIADRLHLVAAWARRHAATIDVNGTRLDAETILALARSQARDEAELLDRFHGFRSFYERYTAVLRERERVLHAAIAEMEQRDDRETRATLRACRLRRPPLAKVRAATAETALATGT